ncbi:MAG: pilus assembly protein TadG-related protein [Oscillospiraceae bacterium]
MVSKFKLFKDEAGQSMVIFVLVFAVLCAGSALAIDLGRISLEQDRLQTAADSAALGGAQDLPSSSAAKSTAVKLAEQNGMLASEIAVSAPFNGDSEKIEVVCTRTVSYTIATVLGLHSKTILASSVAEKTGMNTGPFNYTVFSGSSSDILAINGSSQYIKGNVHSNYKFNMYGSSQNITGSVEAVNSITMNGSCITVGGACQAAAITVNGSGINIGSKVFSAAPIIDMPDFSEAIQAEAQAAGQAYNGNKTFNGSRVSVDSPIYVKGSLTVNGSDFTGSGVVLVSGSITFNGSNLMYSSKDSVCFYSESGNITINGSGIQLEGLVYAPNGTIMMNGSNQTINGRVIGKVLNFNGSSIRITSGEDDLSCLPKMTVRLVE